MQEKGNIVQEKEMLHHSGARKAKLCARMLCKKGECDVRVLHKKGNVACKKKTCCAIEYWVFDRNVVLLLRMFTLCGAYIRHNTVCCVKFCLEIICSRYHSINDVRIIYNFPLPQQDC